MQRAAAFTTLSNGTHLEMLQESEQPLLTDGKPAWQICCSFVRRAVSAIKLVAYKVGNITDKEDSLANTSLR